MDGQRTKINLPEEPGTYWAHFEPAGWRSRGAATSPGYNAILIVYGEEPYMKARLFSLDLLGNCFEPSHRETLIAGPRIEPPKMPENPA